MKPKVKAMKKDLTVFDKFILISYLNLTNLNHAVFETILLDTLVIVVVGLCSLVCLVLYIFFWHIGWILVVVKLSFWLLEWRVLKCKKKNKKKTLIGVIYLFYFILTLKIQKK